MKKYVFILVFILVGLTKTWGQDAFIGEIRMFAGNFAPRGWMFCSGQILSISQNAALFSILGTQYGGDGRTTFALPNLCGRVPVGVGSGPGLTTRYLGEVNGVESVTLTAGEIPPHTHPLYVSENIGTSNTPAQGQMIAAPANLGPNPVKTYSEAGNAVQLSSASVGTNSTSAQAHYNMMPYVVINYIICVNGLYPPRD